MQQTKPQQSATRNQHFCYQPQHPNDILCKRIHPRPQIPVLDLLLRKWVTNDTMGIFWNCRGLSQDIAGSSLAWVPFCISQSGIWKIYAPSDNPENRWGGLFRRGGSFSETNWVGRLSGDLGGCFIVFRNVGVWINLGIGIGAHWREM